MNEASERFERRITNVRKFVDVYEPTLTKFVTDNRAAYSYGPEQVPAVIERMGRAFVSGSYSHFGDAIKATCKALGIKHTRKAMEDFFNAPV